MDLEQSERGGVDILAVRGPIHADDNDAFAEALEGLRRRKRFRLVVDAREIDYINSRAVGTLAAFSRDARLSGGRLVFVSPNLTVSKILKAVGLLSLVESHGTLEEAVAACGAER